MPEKKVHVYETTAGARIEVSIALLAHGLRKIFNPGNRLESLRE